ncbi:MAG: lytic murein transglycosylase [Beijerinckiaceae bacterium]|nr:lytic murein transglycosylase [Beijerinckiaceae bacterium]
MTASARHASPARPALQLARRAMQALILVSGLALVPALPASATQPRQTTPPAQAAQPAQADTAEFQAFLNRLWPDAQKQGITRQTFDLAFRGVTPDSSIIALTRKQSEFVRPIWSYIDSAISASRMERGRAAAEQYAGTLAALERKYGVDRRIVLGVWGMETNFGSFTGDKDVIRSLATLAFKRYRDDFFRDELLVALRILQDGHVERSAMRGSWAGAMGQTQFMPSSFMKYAVDGNGDGTRDIWGTIPDALASTANYLASFGWESGVPWGVEVRLPDGFNLAGAMGMHDFAKWSEAGLARIGGGALPRKGQAMLYLPAGIRGPALLVTENYRVIKKYNSSDAYALGVAHLGDRLLGGAAFQGAWPRNEKRLTSDEIKEVQRKLVAMGLPVGKIDGRIGEISRESVRKAQAKLGLAADGYPDHALLARLKKTP